MTLQPVLLVFAWLTACHATSASAIDWTKIDRSIAKEPAYQSKVPRYGLLVFGPKADKRIWLVLDKDVVYVDADGNGDLTQPGKRVRVKTPDQDPASFEDIKILSQDGKTNETLRFALYGWFNYRQGKDEGVEPCVTVSWGGRWYGAWGDGDRPLVFATRPQDAPILHIGGPLQMGFESRFQHAFARKGPDTFELAVGVGTPGLGKGAFTHLTYWDDGIPKEVRPTAELEFPSPKPGGPPVKVTQVLKERC
jgi:hypothetical protein